MEKTIILNELYDYYQDLLTEKQQEVFKFYYFDNLSLAEIAELLKVSRNAVHTQIQAAAEKLNYYEEKLKLLEKREKIINTLVNKVDNDTIENIKELL